MNIRIERGKAAGRVSAPPSKSMSHRALIAGALSEKSEIHGLAFSKDIEATVGCIKALGAFAEVSEDTVTTGGMRGTSGAQSVLDCNESGSTLRFFIPLCLLKSTPVTLKGSRRLFERPLSVYEDICREQGLLFEKGEDKVTVCGPLCAGSFTVPGNVSSQFITGLLFALPCIEGDSVIRITGKLESESYINLTLKTLSDFGIKIERRGMDFYVPGSQVYKSSACTVEGDYSNAAFLEALNVLGGDVMIEGLSADSLQGDRVYKDLFPAIEQGRGSLDLSDCPDLAPVLFAVAAAKGGARFCGTARLKIKESDRANAMREELIKFGVPVRVLENSVTVERAELKAPEEPLCGHNDHRIVMALSVLCTLTGGTIEGAEAVSKSYPDFFERLSELDIKVTKI